MLVLSAFIALAQAQSNAACTFTFFQLSGTISNPQGNHAFGVNSYATVVGEGETSNNVEKGFIRYSSGSTSYFSNLTFTGRNDNGVSIGNYVPSGSSTAEGFMLKGTATATGRFTALSGSAMGAIPRWIFPARKAQCLPESTTAERLSAQSMTLPVAMVSFTATGNGQRRITRERTVQRSSSASAMGT
jgi:hypothetical protein